MLLSATSPKAFCFAVFTSFLLPNFEAAVLEGGLYFLHSGGAFLLGLLLSGHFFVGKYLADFFLAVVFGGEFDAFSIDLVFVLYSDNDLVTAITVALVVGGPATTAFAQSRQIRFSEASASGSSTPHNTWTGLRNFGHLCAARVSREGYKQALHTQHFGIVRMKAEKRIK